MKKIYAIVFLFLLTGCGYTVRSSDSLPFKEIAIKPIVNMTSQPDLEDTFHRALTEEFIRQGIGVSRSANFSMEGRLYEFKLKTVAEKNEFSREYEALIKADITIIAPDGSRREYLSRYPGYIESFLAETSLNSIVVLKDIATQKALQALARRIVTEVIYQ